jgi:DNA-binding transcriptional LysR family regulator
MRFKSYDGLRLFSVVARHLSFTAAAGELNLTKGAVSYQISRLENDLGFRVFIRQHRGVALTEKGNRLWHASQVAFHELDRAISDLREREPAHIAIGMSTYFASRWLSPRLMTFIATHPQIGLRLQPLIDLMDLQTQKLDMAIRWGKGDWGDMEIELLLPCPAFPVAGASIAARVAEAGLEASLPGLPLLHDRDDSEAWSDWHRTAGLIYRSARDDLVIPDPNVRVQAVIDGQGVALNDELVGPELSADRLFRISTVELATYGYYLVYPEDALMMPGRKEFRAWILDEARSNS